MQECGLGLISIRRAPERLSFAAPRLVRSGPIEPETLARVIRGLHLTADAITTANWVDNGSGWLAIILRPREEVLAVLCQSQYGCNPEITATRTIALTAAAASLSAQITYQAWRSVSRRKGSCSGTRCGTSRAGHTSCIAQGTQASACKHPSMPLETW